MAYCGPFERHRTSGGFCVVAVRAGIALLVDAKGRIGESGTEVSVVSWTFVESQGGGDGNVKATDG